MEYRNYQKSERQKILDFYFENFCKNLPLVKIFGGIPEDELRNNFEPTYGSMLEDGIYGLFTEASEKSATPGVLEQKSATPNCDVAIFR